MVAHIVVVADSDWRLPPDTAADLLRDRWPGSHVRVADPATAEEWPTRNVVGEMRTDVGPLEICVDRDGSTVYIEGHYQATSDAVAWYRSVVPASENILLTNEDGSYVWSVRADVTADDVRAFMKSGDPVHLEPR